jgi:hypothetical protein
MVTNSDQPRQPERTDRRRLVLSVGWSLLIFVLCLFLPAGTLAWSRGWLFFIAIRRACPRKPGKVVSFGLRSFLLVNIEGYHSVRDVILRKEMAIHTCFFGLGRHR